MSAPPEVRIMSTEDLLALPDDDMERELIDGELRERPMTRRNPFHSEATVTLSYFLKAWVRKQPKPRGRVLGGEAGFRIRRNPDTTVGIDIAYISAALAATIQPKARLVDGPPILAVEIPSPSEVLEDIQEKVDNYLQAGVALVWLVDPVYRTVMVYRPDKEPESFNVNERLSGEPHLPGFDIGVAEIFEN